MPSAEAIEQERNHPDNNAPYTDNFGRRIKSRNTVNRNKNQKGRAGQRPYLQQQQITNIVESTAPIMPSARQTGQAVIERHLKTDRVDRIADDGIDAREMRRQQQK